MRDVERRKLEKFERQAAFFTDNAADFPAGKPGGVIAAVNAAIVAEMQTLAAAQVSEAGAAAQGFDDEDELFDDLWLVIKNMNRAANAFEDEIPGTDKQFRLPRNRSEENILATARAFHKDSEPFDAEFVEYGMAETFRADLLALINAVEAAGTRGDSGSEQRGAAVAGLRDAAKRGMANSRRADAVVKIKYANNPQKLAAWAIASHLEKPPKRAPKPA